jgi:uncharacterized delta-60 repeat protein
MRYKNSIILVILILMIPTAIIFNDFNPIQNNEDNFKELKISFTENWLRMWDAGVDEYGQAIAIDPVTGDVFVAGYNSSTDNDGILISYDSDGNYQWNFSYNEGINEYFYDVVIDSVGNIFATGANGTIYPNYDIILVKINPDGELVWDISYDSGFYDGAWALEIDSEDNIYVVGQTFTTSDAIIILKYNSSGHLQWSSIYDAPGYQAGRDIVLDSTNNIYIAGVNRPLTDNDMLVVKFDSSGNQLWNRTWGGSQYDEGWDIAIDSYNNIYATGYTQSYGAVQRDFVVLKYSNEGNWQWNRTWGTNANDEARGIAVDSADNIYLGGYGLGTNISLVKYDLFGNLIWYKHWETISQDFCHDLEVDTLDKLYITGYNTSGPVNDLFIAKFSIESPGKFVLSYDPGIEPDDGYFTLNWNAPRAINYSIYQYSSYITKINDSLTLLANETNALSLPITNYPDGTYYFKGVAFNDYGNSTSNCISVTVTNPTPSTSKPKVYGYNLLLTCLIIGLTSVILIKKKSKH